MKQDDQGLPEESAANGGTASKAVATMTQKCAKDRKADAVETPELKVFATQTDRARIPFWIVDGEAYDLSKFATKHPGGDIWFQMNVCRDISVLFHTCHVDPVKIMPILRKYKITKDHPNHDVCNKENLLPKMGVPFFLMSKEFDARKHLHQFDFQNETHLLNVLRKTVKTEAFQMRITAANFWFDMCCYMLLAMYGALTAGFMLDAFYIPKWLAIAAYVVLRTAFGASGHYYLHAKKPGTLDGLFDMNYVGTSYTGFDGHVMMHHAYTHTGADVKTNFFGGMRVLPQLYRPWAYTIHKLGGALTGCLIRVGEFMFVDQIFQPMILAFRLWIMAEFLFAYYARKIVPFVIQFIITLWFNSFLVLSSHDFEDFSADPAGGYHQDWGVFQINNCHDMTLFGNKYIDIFMSAGLSSHRAHHLFPYQSSGFANIITEDLIAKVLPDYGLTWDKPKVFWWDRAPYVFRFCFLHPPTGMEDMPFWRQHLSLSALSEVAKFVGTGFIGINSI